MTPTCSESRAWTLLASAEEQQAESTFGEATPYYGARIQRSGALIFAAQQGRLKNIELLLARGADVNKVEFVLLRLTVMYEKLD